jgi:hypothetical protein
MVLLNSVTGFAATTDIGAKLRLVRSSSTLTGFFHNGTGFVALGSTQVPTGPTRFVLNVGSFSPTGAAVSVAFDNFKVNAGTVVCPGKDFDFAVDSLRVDGNVNSGLGFFDDFDDNSLTTFPTSEIFSFSPIAESGGFLNLRSADGANNFTPGFLVDNCFLGLQTGPEFRLKEGSGNAVISASFRADIPLQGQGAGLQLFTLGTDELVNMNFSFSGSSTTVVALVQPTPGTQFVNSVPVNLTGVSRIILRLTFDDTTNQVRHSFSTDGGGTFTTIPVSVPGKVLTTGPEAIVSVFGSVAISP